MISYRKFKAILEFYPKPVVGEDRKVLAKEVHDKLAQELAHALKESEQ